MAEKFMERFEAWRYELGDRVAFAVCHRALFGDGDVRWDLMNYEARGENYRPDMDHIAGQVPNG